MFFLVFNYHANHSRMAAQWGVEPSAALHPVPVCACLIDTSHTSYHCSLWADCCSQWFILPASSMVLHVCCSTAPRSLFPACACARFCASILGRQKNDTITTVTERKKGGKLSEIQFCKIWKESEWLTESYYQFFSLLSLKRQHFCSF